MAARTPWPAIGFVAGIIGWAGIRYGVGWYAATRVGPAMPGQAHAAYAGALDGCAWALLGVCWVWAGLAWINRRHRVRMAESKAAPVETAAASPAVASMPDAEPAKPPSRNETAPSHGEPSKAADAPICPRCGAAMYQRFSMQDGRMYWGCVKYPACKGAQPL